MVNESHMARPTDVTGVTQGEDGDRKGRWLISLQREDVIRVTCAGGRALFCSKPHPEEAH
jgi:hypothetical protein